MIRAERFVEMLAQHGAEAFPGERPEWRWRVSQDVYDSLAELVTSPAIEVAGETVGRVTSLVVGNRQWITEKVFGYDLNVDATLPANAIILEPSDGPMTPVTVTVTVNATPELGSGT